MTHWIIPPRIGMPMGPEQSYLFTRVLYVHCHYNNISVIMGALVALTNANRQALRVVPWTSHSALVLSTQALFVASEGEYYSPITATSLIHLTPVVPRHQLALWVVPLYRSGHCSCVLPTVHSLISHPDGQCHVRMWVRQASATKLQDSSSY